MINRNCFVRAGFIRRFIFPLVLGLAMLPPLRAAESSAKVAFDIPAGLAADTLKRAALQARLEIAFPAETVRGVSTRAIRGDYAPVEAMNLMLGGSGVAALRDERTGAITIRRFSPPAGEEKKALPKKTDPTSVSGSAVEESDRPGEAAPRVLEAVVITGKVSINSTPEEIKRLNVAIVDSMTAEQIGQLPDASLRK